MFRTPDVISLVPVAVHSQLMGNYFASCLRLALGACVHRSNGIHIHMHGAAMAQHQPEQAVWPGVRLKILSSLADNGVQVIHPEYINK